MILTMDLFHILQNYDIDSGKQYVRKSEATSRSQSKLKFKNTYATVAFRTSHAKKVHNLTYLNINYHITSYRYVVYVV